MHSTNVRMSDASQDRAEAPISKPQRLRRTAQPAEPGPAATALAGMFTLYAQRRLKEVDAGS